MWLIWHVTHMTCDSYDMWLIWHVTHMTCDSYDMWLIWHSLFKRFIDLHISLPASLVKGRFWGETLGQFFEELPSGGRLDILLASGCSLDLAHGLAKAFRNDEPEERAKLGWVAMEDPIRVGWNLHVLWYNYNMYTYLYIYIYIYIYII